MSRLKDAVLAKQTAYSGHNALTDLANGGQNGYMPSIGRVGADGKFYDEWISNQAYVSRNIIPVVLSYPKFFDFMPEKEKWIEAYKALIELHPLSITGLSSGLTVEFDEHAVGAAGEKQAEITNVTRAVSNLSFTYKEKAGKSITKFLDAVIRYGYMDPDTKSVLVAKYIENIDEIGGMYSADMSAGSIIFLETDITNSVIIDAWLCVNCLFKGNGERTGKRNLTAAGDAPELSIEMTSITMNNESVLVLADKILAGLTVLSKIPDTDLTLPIDNVESAISNSAPGFNN